MQFEQMKNLLTEDLWLSSGMPYDYSMDNGRARGPGFFLDGTAILKGVLDLLSQSFFIFPLVKLVNPHQSTISIHGGNHDNHGESFGNLGSNDLSHLLWWPPPRQKSKDLWILASGKVRVAIIVAA